MANSLILAAAEGTEHSINHALSWTVGGITLVVFLAAVLGLIAFAGGREHS